jgi:hypothetical protein
MSEMVGRITQAIRDKRDMSLCALCDRHGHTIRCSCEEMARAAIEAMREPTAAMVEAGDDAQTETDGPYSGEQVAMLSAVPWRAMIDAAPSPNPKRDT